MGEVVKNWFSYGCHNTDHKSAIKHNFVYNYLLSWYVTFHYLYVYHQGVGFCKWGLITDKKLPLPFLHSDFS